MNVQKNEGEKNYPYKFYKYGSRKCTLLDKHKKGKKKCKVTIS